MNRKRMAVLTALIVSLLVSGCRTQSEEKIGKLSVSGGSAANGGVKPVILIIVDSLMDKPLRQAVREGRAPALKFLMSSGSYYPKMVSSFPTMSVTIDSTIMTGTYANRHHVPGLVWYSGKENRMIYYGNGAKEALKINQLQVLADAIYQMNQVQLSRDVTTIHEALAAKGKDTASINGTIFRGPVEHALKVPGWISNLTRFPEQVTVTGPKWLSYAVMARQDPDNETNTRPWKKFGMNDDFSARELAYLIGRQQLPAFTLAYFPENDNIVHRKGPAETSGIAGADKALQQVLNAFGTWEQAVKQAVWIVIGDSGQDQVHGRRISPVDLRPLLGGYRIARLSRPAGAGDQLVIAANERMAYIYALDPSIKLRDIVNRLKKEKKLDIIAAKENGEIRVASGNQAQSFSYRPVGRYTDDYGQSWSLSGSPGVADITVKGSRLMYGKYPDVLARLYGGMNSHEGRYVVVTIEPGYEMAGESSPRHSGGAHGSLHEAESIVPLIVSGTKSRPDTLRVIDLKDWILKLAGG